MKRLTKTISVTSMLAIAGASGAIFTMIQDTAAKAETIGCVDSLKTYYDVPLSRKAQDIIRDVCNDYEVDMPLVLALIGRESDYEAKVIAGDDYGLMQLNKVNHDTLTHTLGIYNFLDIEQNVRGGVSILKPYLEKYGVTKGLMCYHLGETGAKAKWEKGITSDEYTNTIILNAICLNYVKKEVII